MILSPPFFIRANSIHNPYAVGKSGANVLNYLKNSELIDSFLYTR